MDMPPGQRFISFPVSRSVEIRVDPGRLKSLRPDLRPEILAPAVESRAPSPRFEQCFAETPVAPGKDTFQAAGLWVMPVEADATVTQRSPQHILSSFHFGDGKLGNPLKGSVGFGYERGNTDSNLAIATTSRQGQHLAGQVGDSQNVFIGLRRQANHKVQLDAGPTGPERGAGGFKQVRFRYSLVDDIPQSLGSGLRCEGQPRTPNLLDFVGQFDGKAVDPQGRQRKTDPLRCKTGQQFVGQLTQTGIVRRTERYK